MSTHLRPTGLYKDPVTLVVWWWSVCLALSVALLPEVYADDSMYRWYPISVASGTPTAASQGSFMGYDGPPHNVNGDERLIVADSSSTWAFDLDSGDWTQIQPTLQNPIRDPVYGTDGVRRRLLASTGGTSNGDVGTTYAFDFATNQWSQLATTPAAIPVRHGASGGIFPGGDTLVVFGGFGLNECKSTPVTCSPCRCQDTWALDLATNTWTELTPVTSPLNRCLQVMSPLSAAGYSSVMFSGCAGGYGPCPMQDAWLLSSGSSAVWTALDSSAPHPPWTASGASMATLGTGKAILYGVSGSQHKTWTTNYTLMQSNAGWRELDTNGTTIGARSNAAVTVRTGRQGGAHNDSLILFGGTSARDLWELRLSSQGEAPPPSFPGGQTPTTPAESVGTASNIALPVGGALLSFEPVGTDAIRITVTVPGSRWLGFGISDGESVSMTGNGAGSDIVVCSGGTVTRYAVTVAAMPSSGDQISGASCTQTSALTTLTFDRDIAAGSSGTRDITPGARQQVIVAHGNDGSNTLAYHGSNRGGAFVDFATGQVAELEARQPPAILWVHIFAMLLSWGFMLPWGVALASRSRTVPGAPKGAWFKLHRRLQVIGVILQLVGFAGAVAYVQENSQHFTHSHTIIGMVVVVLGALQPVNAFFRPHPPAPGKPKSTGRLVFELVHKGSGWVAVLLGMFNVLYGVALLGELSFSVGARWTAGVLGGCGITSAVAYFIVASVAPNNRLSRFLTGAKMSVSEAGTELGPDTEAAK